jgi:hypothetical protein
MAILTQNCSVCHSSPQLLLSDGFDFLPSATFASRHSHHRTKKGLEKLTSSSLRRVTFPINPVTEVRFLPFTSEYEAERIYYQAEDYKKFRIEARSQRIENELILKIEGDLYESDIFEIEFSMITAFVSVIMAVVFIFACALSVVEKAYATNQESCGGTQRTSWNIAASGDASLHKARHTLLGVPTEKLPSLTNLPFH